jgi:hypothetical protein
MRCIKRITIQTTRLAYRWRGWLKLILGYFLGDAAKRLEVSAAGEGGILVVGEGATVAERKLLGGEAGVLIVGEGATVAERKLLGGEGGILIVGEGTNEAERKLLQCS